MHQSYVRSLKMIITHLDIARVEQMPDGSTLERSTRDWAMQHTLADGITNAQCDIVNGSSDHNAYLLVPTPHYDDIKEAFKAYQLRLENKRPGFVTVSLLFRLLSVLMCPLRSTLIF